MSPLHRSIWCSLALMLACAAATAEAPTRPSSMQHYGTWIHAARQAYTRVLDYQCTFTKRERIDGKLQEEQTATMKVRSQPFSVYAKFTAPKAVAGREGSFVAGRLGGKMKAKSGGAIGLVGYVTLDPRDPKAMKGSRHSITEAGIGNLIDRLVQAHAKPRGAGDTPPSVTVAEVEVNGRTCVRFEIVDSAADGAVVQARTAVYFDKESNLPVRFEAFDARGELVESFGYADLRFNIGLTDSAFP